MICIFRLTGGQSRIRRRALEIGASDLLAVTQANHGPQENKADVDHIRPTIEGTTYTISEDTRR